MLRPYRPAGLVALVAVLVVGLGGCSAATSSPSTSSPSTSSPSTTEESPGATSSAPPQGVDLVAATGGQPCGVLATESAVWVSLADAGTLLRLDPQTGETLGSTPLDRTPCEILAAAGSLWVVTQSGVVDRVDPATGAVVARIEVGEASYEAAWAAGSVWVSNRGSGTLSRIDPGTDRVVATLRLPIAHPGGLVAVGRTLWVGNDGSGETDVVVLDTATSATRRVAVGPRPAYVASAGGAVWFSLVERSSVARVDPRTRTVLGTSPAGARPVNLAPGEDGRSVWVPDDAGDVVTRLDARTGSVVASLGVGAGPAVVDAGPDGRIWVTLYDAGEVWALDPDAG